MKTFTIYGTGICFSIGMALGMTMAVAGQAPSFEDIDINGDGYISKAESMISRDMNKNWAELDTNHDGRASVSEFSRFESAENYSPTHDADEPEPGAAPM
ncbi:MAG: hypothetical protein COB30_001815 [Ectothiorhodospiraceae bacterium]|nr:hypothetical protein [Ectothiorhodospiraceae bacterium]